MNYFIWCYRVQISTCSQNLEKQHLRNAYDFVSVFDVVNLRLYEQSPGVIQIVNDMLKNMRCL